MTIAHFGQGNPEAKVWFVGKEANFPKELVDALSHSDSDLSWFVEYLRCNQEGEYLWGDSLKAIACYPHPFFTLEHMGWNRGKIDGITYWKRIFGRESKPRGSDRSIVEKAWEEGELFFTELAKKWIYQIPGENPGSSVKRTWDGEESTWDIDSLVELINAYSPRLILVTRQDAKREILHRVNCRIHNMSKHPSRYWGPEKQKEFEEQIMTVIKNQ